MENPQILEDLFDKKIIQILTVFYEDEEAEFYLMEVSKKAKVPIATTFRIVNKLVGLGVLEQLNVKKLKLYKLSKNKTSEFLKKIMKKDKQILDLFIEKISPIKGLQKAILQGKETKNKANILLIGDIEDKELIRSAVYEIKEKYNYTITHLELKEDQYEQMSVMGLYSGEKKVVYQKKYDATETTAENQ